MTSNAISARNTIGQCTSTISAHGCTSRRSYEDQTIQSAIPPAKRTTCCTKSTMVESRPFALMKADILQIVDTAKKGLSHFTAGT